MLDEALDYRAMAKPHGACVAKPLRRLCRMTRRRIVATSSVPKGGKVTQALVRGGAVAAAAAAILLLAASTALAAPGKEKRHGRSNYDVRASRTVVDRAAEYAAKPSAAVKALEGLLGTQGVVAIDGLTGTPRMVGRLDGYLTGPSGASAADVALGYVRAHAGVFGIDLSTLQLARQSTSAERQSPRLVATGRERHPGLRKRPEGQRDRRRQADQRRRCTARRARRRRFVTVGHRRTGARADEAGLRRGGRADPGHEARRRAPDDRLRDRRDGRPDGLRHASGQPAGWDLLVQPDASAMYREVVDAQTSASSTASRSYRTRLGCSSGTTRGRRTAARRSWSTSTRTAGCPTARST